MRSIKLTGLSRQYLKNMMAHSPCRPADARSALMLYSSFRRRTQRGSSWTPIGWRRSSVSGEPSSTGSISGWQTSVSWTSGWARARKLTQQRCSRARLMSTRTTMISSTMSHQSEKVRKPARSWTSKTTSLSMGSLKKVTIKLFTQKRTATSQVNYQTTRTTRFWLKASVSPPARTSYNAVVKSSTMRRWWRNSRLSRRGSKKLGWSPSQLISEQLRQSSYASKHELWCYLYVICINPLAGNSLLFPRPLPCFICNKTSLLQMNRKGTY